MKGKKHEGEKDRPGVDEAAKDAKTKPMAYGRGYPEEEAEDDRDERKHGGKAEEKREDKKEDEKKKRDHMKRKRGGKTVEMHGEEKEHAGRKPRKSGGRAGCEASPFTAAHKGTAATGRKLEKETMD
jgi:hypothetical protein